MIVMENSHKQEVLFKKTAVCQTDVLCTKSNIALYLTAFLNYLSAKALHTGHGIVTSYYHVLKLYVMASTLLDSLVDR